MVQNMARVGRKFEFYQIQANSSQVGSQTIHNLEQVENMARVGLSWEYQEWSITEHREIIVCSLHNDTCLFTRMESVVFGNKQNWPSHSQEWSTSNLPCSLTRNIALYKHGELGSSYYQFSLHHLLYDTFLSVKRLGECTFWAKAWKGWKVGRMYVLSFAVKRV